MNKNSELLEKLRKMKLTDQERNQNDVYMRTLKKLLSVEKGAIHGGKTIGKNSKFDKIIDEEFKKYVGGK